MKKNIIIFTLFFSFLSHATILVSDLDDTIKVTNVSNTSQALWNAMFSKTAFKGMPEVLKLMEKYSSELSILTGSPTLIKKKVISFLHHHDIPYKNLYTRKLRDITGGEAYKKNTLEKIAERSDEPFILIGDNTQKDEAVYLNFLSTYQSRVKTIYIRKIANIVSDSRIVNFYTAFDIAVNEYLEKRMTLSEVSAIAKELLLEPKMVKYIPSFAYCPKNLKVFNKVPTSLVTPLVVAVRNKIIRYCESR